MAEHAVDVLPATLQDLIRVQPLCVSEIFEVLVAVVVTRIIKSFICVEPDLVMLKVLDPIGEFPVVVAI